MKEKIKTQWVKFKKYLIKKLGGVDISEIPASPFKKEVEFISSTNIKPVVIHGIYKADPHVYEDSANYRKLVLENLRKELVASMEEIDGIVQIEIDEQPDIFTGKLNVKASIIVLPFCEVNENV